MTARADPRHSTVLYSAEQLAEGIGAVASAMNEVLGASRPLFIVVLRGAVVFAADLVRRLTVSPDVDFLAVTPFGEGRVRIVHDVSADVHGRHVVVVEDIVDTGLTLSFLLRMLAARDPASVDVVTLFDRPARRLVDVPVRWRAFEVDERFVVGFGMDHAGRYRNLSEVRAVTDVTALGRQPQLIETEAYPRR